jgi:hypothetical protein
MEECGHAAFPGFCTSKRACSKDPVVSLCVQRSETYSGSCRSCTREVCMVAGMLEGNELGIANAPQGYCTCASRRGQSCHTSRQVHLLPSLDLS